LKRWIRIRGAIDGFGASLQAFANPKDAVRQNLFLEVRILEEKLGG